MVANKTKENRPPEGGRCIRSFEGYRKAMLNDSAACARCSASIFQVLQEIFEQGVELVRIVHKQRMPVAIENLKLRARNFLLHI